VRSGFLEIEQSRRRPEKAPGLRVVSWLAAKVGANHGACDRLFERERI
jgi:hypothetical protein